MKWKRLFCFFLAMTILVTNISISDLYSIVTWAKEENEDLGNEGEIVLADEIINEDEITLPQKISNVAAAGTNNQIVLSWSMAHEIDTEIYRIYRKMDMEDEFICIKQINSRATLSYVDEEVIAYQNYDYYVVAVNQIGYEGEPSKIVSAMAVKDTETHRIIKINPMNGSTIYGKTAIIIDARSDSEVRKIELYISKDQGVTWELLSNNNSNYVNYQLDTSIYEDQIILIKGLSYNKEGDMVDNLIHTYRIDNKGPEQVTGLTYTSTATSITLRWNDVADQDFSFFRVEKKQSDGSFHKVQDVYTTLGVNLYGLASDTEYIYRVAAYDKLGNRGTVSEELTARTQKDTSAPVITKITPNADYFAHEIKLKITANDNTGIAEIKLQTSVNSIVWEDYKTVTFDGSKKTETASETLSLDDIPEGVLFVRGIATDISGNISDDTTTAPYVQYIVDRTAPAVPTEVTANSVTGAIELRWKMGAENDLNGYTVYRSLDGKTYAVLAEGLNSVNYWDRSVEKDTTYFYKVSVSDRAGNVSDYSEAVEAVMAEDITEPKIESLLPSTGTRVGTSNKKFSVMVSDNWKVDSVQITYTVNDSEDEHTLLSETNINYYYKVLEKDIPIEDFKDGDILHITVAVTDKQGLKTEKGGIEYVVDKTAPRIMSVSAEADLEKITIHWTGNEEDDLAGYRIYRGVSGKYTLIGQRSGSATNEYTYEDYNAESRQAYTYKIAAVDQSGNTSEKITEEVQLERLPVISAILNCDKVMEYDVDYYFDATASVADYHIVSYRFDFGDGESIEGTDAKVVHRYAETGSYTVTLTITDINGNQNVTSTEVSIEEARLLGTVRVKAVTPEGEPISGMPVYFDLYNTTDNIKYTDPSGYVSFIAGAGSYSLGAYADGYLPDKAEIVLRAGMEVEAELVMVQESIVTGEFEVHRMTLDEIKEAGIDVSDPANQQLVQIILKLSYGSTPISMNVITDGNKIYHSGTVIVDTDEGKRELKPYIIPTNTAASDGNGSGSQKVETSIIAIMDIPVTASFLKEFFDVKLHIINQADAEFELTNNVITLNVPKGLTIMDSNDTKADSTIEIPSIKGQEKKNLRWILRGDTAGSYDLTADYRAVLDMFDTVVEAEFKTDTPIEVYGLDGIKLIADINKTIVYGGLYFDLSLQNVGGSTIYLPTIDVLGNIVRNYQSGKEDDIAFKEVELLGVRLENSSGYSQFPGTEEKITELAVGEKMTNKYVSYDTVTYEDMSEHDIAYLQEAIYKTGDELGIDIEINMVDMELYSMDDAEEKVSEIFSNPQRYSLYHYFMNHDNFNYYVNALENDADFLKRLKEAAYKLASVPFKWDLDVFTNDDVENITRQYIMEMLMDESYQKSVELRIDQTYLEATKKIISFIETALPEDFYDDAYYDDTTAKNIIDILEGEENLRSLAQTLKIEGHDALSAKIVTIALSTGVSTVVVEGIKALVGKKEFVQATSDALKSELKGLGYVLDIINNSMKAWNTSQEIVNQLVTINASKYEAEVLFEMLLNHPEINSIVYDEIQRLSDGLQKGFETQADLFVDEFMKLNFSSTMEVLTSKTLSCISKSYGLVGLSSPLIIFTALKLGFGALDYLFGWEDSVNQIQSLRVAACLSYALCQETKLRSVSNEYIDFMFALKYLIKVRIVGEKALVNLLKEDGVLEIISPLNNGAMQNIDEYYTQYRETVLSYRDALFGEVPQTFNKPDAPEVSIDYLNETTAEAFDATCEYSFNGTDWTVCDGSPIALNPGTAGRHLWVRVRETENNLSGNIRKLYIPARNRITEDITVKFKEGVYYVEGLEQKYFYEFSNEKREVIESTQVISGTNIQIPEEIQYTYFVIMQDADNTSFRSQVSCLLVENARTLTLTNDSLKGTVSGAGSYFVGDKVTVRAEAKDGYEFVGWYNGEKLASDEAQYQFTIFSDSELEARYKELQFVTVTFEGWNQNAIGVLTCTAENCSIEDIQVPAVPIPSGREFTGWQLDGKTYTDEDISEAILEKIHLNESVVVTAVFKQKDVYYQVTVTNGTLKGGIESGVYKPATVLTVIADSPENGKKFAYWEKDGICVSYDEAYSFYMPNNDTVLEAVYKREAVQVEAVGTTYLESVAANTSTKKLTFVTIGNVPEGCKIKYAGIVATSSSEKATNGTELTVSNADYVRGGGEGLQTYKYTWTKSKVTDDQTWYVRSYLKYIDANGKTHEIYGDLKIASLED